MQFALAVMSSGCYEDDADAGEVMTLTGKSKPCCSHFRHLALYTFTLNGQSAEHSRAAVTSLKHQRSGMLG